MGRPKKVPVIPWTPMVYRLWDGTTLASTEYCHCPMCDYVVSVNASRCCNCWHPKVDSSCTDGGKVVVDSRVVNLRAHVRGVFIGAEALLTAENPGKSLIARGLRDFWKFHVCTIVHRWAQKWLF